MKKTEYKMYIGGNWVNSISGKSFDIENPSTEEIIGTAAQGETNDVDQAVEAARIAFPEWRDKKPVERARLLFDLGRSMEDNVDELAEMESIDSGKPFKSARGEVLRTARYFEFYAGATDKFYGESIPLGPDYIDFTLREPVGVTAHIVPWNFPLSMLGRSVAPALAMGNTAVVKPAEQTPLTAIKLAELMESLHFPAGVYNVVTGFGDEAGAPLAKHPGVDSITFTGSVETGRQVMRAAAEHIRPVVLELGGKSPNIIFADADIDLSVAETAKAIYSNTGQICSAGSRLIVEASIKDLFIDKLAAHTNTLKVGPALESPDMGPLISREQYERVAAYIKLGKKEGANLVVGGNRPENLDQGYFMAPTIFDQVKQDMRVAQEEIFGPVLTVLEFNEDHEALEIANNVLYGLVAGVFTNDINRALRLAKDLQAGQIYINEYFAGGVETPFGGYKQSGFGRERGMHALLNYTRVKNVAIRIR